MESKVTHKYPLGTKVIANGSYEGTITRLCEWSSDLYEIRLARGTICVGDSEFTVIAK
jgi:hypothetical protein